MLGVHKRMGDQTIPDLAVYIEATVEFQNILEEDWMVAQSIKEAEEIEELACAILGGISTGLQGEEITKIGTAGLLQHFNEGRDHPKSPHVPLCLLGRFKGEIGKRYHILPVAWEIASGLKNGVWFSRLVRSFQRKRQSHSPVFRFDNGKRKAASFFEGGFLDTLQRVQGRNPRAIGESVKVHEQCGISRTLRRTATTRARLTGVPEADIEANNR